MKNANYGSPRRSAQGLEMWFRNSSMVVNFLQNFNHFIMQWFCPGVGQHVTRHQKSIKEFNYGSEKQNTVTTKETCIIIKYIQVFWSLKPTNMDLFPPKIFLVSFQIPEFTEIPPNHIIWKPAIIKDCFSHKKNARAAFRDLKNNQTFSARVFSATPILHTFCTLQTSFWDFWILPLNIDL